MVTVFNHNISASGFENTQYFSTGQIIIIGHNVNFIIGGLSFFRNGGAQNIIYADQPVFRYMLAGDNVRFITNGSLNDRIIQERYDDYSVRINANINLGSGQEGLVCIRFDIQAFNVVFRRLHYLYSNDLIINYDSIVSSYPQALSTDVQTTPLINPGISYTSINPQLQISPYHKLVDSNIHQYYYGYQLSIRTFQNQNFHSIIIANGINSSTLSLYNNKGLGFILSLPTAMFLHVNPYLNNNKNNSYINSNFRFSRQSGTDLIDVEFEKNYKLDQFGNFGERGWGQIAIYTPTNIDINSGAGFQFNTLSQTIKFRLPIQANGSTNCVYIAFQRKVDNQDFSDFDKNKSYQNQWGFTPIFAFPTLTTVQLGLPDTIATGQCLSIVPVGTEYEYTFQFNITRLSDIMNWHGVIGYVVIESPTNCESHVLFEANYQAIPPTVGTLVKVNETVNPYDTEYNVPVDVTRVLMTPTYFNWFEFDFDCFNIPNAKFKRVIIRLLDFNTATVELARYDIDLFNHQTNGSGYPVLSIRRATQVGNVNNHPDSYVHLYSYGASFIRLHVPVVHRIEEWLSLLPNNGVYFNNSLPNNGQNYNFLNYYEAFLKISFEYEYQNQNFLLDFESKRIRFIPINTMAPSSAPLISSNINGIYDVNLTPVSTYYVGDTYILRLDNAIPYPTEECVSIRAVYEGVDNVITWGTWYPNQSNYRPSNTYNKRIINESPDLYSFIPDKEGTLTFYVIFERAYLGKSSMICKRISIDVIKRPDVLSLPNKVSAQCCDVIEVEPMDYATFIIHNNSTIQLEYDGNVVTIPTQAIYQQYAYDVIKGIQVIVLSFNELYNTYGYGTYRVIAGSYSSDIYCLVQSSSNRLIVDLIVNKKLNNLDFKSNPVRFYYRLPGYINKESVSSESEEIIFTNGNIIEVKKSNEKIYNVTIKKCNYRIYNELATYCIFASNWGVDDYNVQNPLNIKDLIVLPPTSITPEWLYNTNYCNFDLELKKVISIISNKC